jgi:hypothetical protein
MREGLLPLVVSFLGNKIEASNHVDMLTATCDSSGNCFNKLKCNEWFYGLADRNNASSTQAYMVPCTVDTHENYYSACSNARNVEINNPFKTISASNSASDPFPYCASEKTEHMNVMNFAHSLGTSENYDPEAAKSHPFNLAVHRIDATAANFDSFENYYCIDQAGALTGQTKAGKQHIPDFKYFSPESHNKNANDLSGYDNSCVSINYKKLRKHGFTEGESLEHKYCDTLERHLQDNNWKDNGCAIKNSLICKMELGELALVDETMVREMAYVDQHLKTCNYSPFHHFMQWPLFVRIVIAVFVGGVLLYCVGMVVNCCMDEIKIETKEEKLQRELEEEQRRQYIHRPLSRGEAWR